MGFTRQLMVFVAVLHGHHCTDIRLWIFQSLESSLKIQSAVEKQKNIESEATTLWEALCKLQSAEGEKMHFFVLSPLTITATHVKLGGDVITT